MHACIKEHLVGCVELKRLSLSKSACVCVCMCVQGLMEMSEPVSAAGVASRAVAGRGPLFRGERNHRAGSSGKPRVNCSAHPSSRLAVTCQLSRSRY